MGSVLKREGTIMRKTTTKSFISSSPRIYRKYPMNWAKKNEAFEDWRPSISVNVCFSFEWWLSKALHCCSSIVIQSLAIIMRVDEIAFELHRILIASNANKSSLSPLNGFAFNQAVIMEWVTGPKIAHIIIPHGKKSIICYVISSHVLFSQRDFIAAFSFQSLQTELILSTCLW